MLTHMHWADWLVVALYAVFAVVVGVKLTKKAEANVDQFFLSGRSLPWWIAGTSMVATTFAADTPLVITKWVRDGGIWQNWLWWNFAISGMLGVFLFSRYWRRGGVMTKAELAELRYGGRDAAVLRGTLGVFHAGLTNTVTLCWVLLASAKISDVLFGVDKAWALVAACAISLSYSVLAGFWGVVLTDLVQFAMAMTGAIALAVITWSAVGGGDAVVAAAELGKLRPETLRFLPAWGKGGVLDVSFWTPAFTIVTAYLGVQWWASEGIDGSGVAVQRILASKDDRHGMLASLWYNVAHYAFRPWPWICVALASMLVLPHREVVSEVAGKVRSTDGSAIVVAEADDAPGVEISLYEADAPEDWPLIATVKKDDKVKVGDVVAATDSELAYVVMMTRYLPIGLLGLVVASLLAAFMSTIDTHVNLASSFFVNDVYRRFLRRGAGDVHYVRVAQAASAVVLVLGAMLAYVSKSISGLFVFYLAVLAGVGPVYILRWLWWRVRASTEVTAMIASTASALLITFGPSWGLPDTPLSANGALTEVGRHIVVTLFSMLCAFVAIVVAKRPDPASLVDFYRRVRPMGWWGPVRELAPDVERPREGAPIAVGVICGLCAIYGPMLGVGWYLLGRRAEAGIAALIMVAGIVGVRWSLSRLSTTRAA